MSLVLFRACDYRKQYTKGVLRCKEQRVDLILYIDILSDSFVIEAAFAGYFSLYNV